MKLIDASNTKQLFWIYPAESDQWCRNQKLKRFNAFGTVRQNAISCSVNFIILQDYERKGKKELTEIKTLDPRNQTCL